MRWAVVWLGGVVACGPAVIVDDGGVTETDDSDDTSTTDTTGTSSSTSLPGTSSTSGTPMTTPSTTVPDTTSSATDTDGSDSSSSTSGPLPPDVPEFDCFDDECGDGQWCGSSHTACEAIPEITECALAPTHEVLTLDGVVGSFVDVLVADVDGDMDDDVIVLDAAQTVTVVLQDGGLVPQASQALPIPAEFVQLGDLDEDGIEDLVVASTLDVHWAPGLGDGTFGAFGELLGVGQAMGGLGVGPAGDDQLADDVVAFVPAASTLILGVSDGTGLFTDVEDTMVGEDTPGPFVAIDRGFSSVLSAVGSIDFVYTYDPDPMTLQFVLATDERVTNAGLPVVDVDLARSGGGVFTYGFVNLGSWTLGGNLSQIRGIATPSRLVVGSGDAGFEYAYVTEDDRVLLVDQCYDAYDLGAAPVAADAGDLNGDGSGDLAVVSDGVPVALLLSGSI
jgi:hypothetical protein